MLMLARLRLWLVRLTVGPSLARAHRRMNVLEQRIKDLNKKLDKFGRADKGRIWSRLAAVEKQAKTATVDVAQLRIAMATDRARLDDHLGPDEPDYHDRV